MIAQRQHVRLENRHHPGFPARGRVAGQSTCIGVKTSSAGNAFTNRLHNRPLAVPILYLCHVEAKMLGTALAGKAVPAIGQQHVANIHKQAGHHRRFSHRLLFSYVRPNDFAHICDGVVLMPISPVVHNRAAAPHVMSQPRWQVRGAGLSWFLGLSRQASYASAAGR